MGPDGVLYLRRTSYRLGVSGHHVYPWLWSWVRRLLGGERRWIVGWADGNVLDPSRYWVDRATFESDDRRRCQEEFDVAQAAGDLSCEMLRGRGWGVLE